MRNISRRTVITGIAATIAAPAIVQAAAPSRPNVILIIGDDLSARMLLRALPKLHLRTDLMWYPNCFSEVSQCDPARYTMFSGQRAAVHRVTDNTKDKAFDWTNALHVWCKQAGYRVGHIGKIDHRNRTAPPFECDYSVLFSLVSGASRYTNFTLIENGVSQLYPWNATTLPQNYVTDVLGMGLLSNPAFPRKMGEFLDTVQTDESFFITWCP